MYQQWLKKSPISCGLVNKRSQHSKKRRMGICGCPTGCTRNVCQVSSLMTLWLSNKAVPYKQLCILYTRDTNIYDIVIV